MNDGRDLPRMRDRQRVAVAGLVVVRQRPSTAKGTLFLLLEDKHGFINVIASIWLCRVRWITGKSYLHVKLRISSFTCTPRSCLDSVPGLSVGVTYLPIPAAGALTALFLIEKVWLGDPPKTDLMYSDAPADSE